MQGMPSFRAQEANQGLEDALVLATLINRIRNQQAGNNGEAIAVGEVERVRGRAIHPIEEGYGNLD